MDLIAIAGVGLVAAAAAVLLKQYKPEYAMLVSLAAAALIFGWILVDLIPAFSVMRELMERAALSSEVVKILIKALGVCCLCELAGQLAIASKIDLAGKVTILLLALPLFRELLELSLSLMDR